MSDQPYRRLSPLTPVVRSFIVVVAAATTIGRDLFRQGELGPAAAAFGALLVAGAVYGIASWARTKFWIESDELRVDTGVISRQSRRIRIDRLQGIDIVQPFVARLFGLAELRMDVAGGNSREGSLAFLRLTDARELKDTLLARRDAVRAGDGDAEVEGDGTSGTHEAVIPPAPQPDRILARVDLATLLLSILLVPETLALLLIGLLFFIGFVATGQWVGASAALPALAGLLLVQFKRFSGNYNFTVSETAAGLHVRRGLFDLNSQTIALPRLQGIVITEPVIWRNFGWARLDVSIAGYASASEDSSGPSVSIALPVGDRALVMWLAEYVLGGVNPDHTQLSAPPAAAKWVSPFGRHFMGAGASKDVVVTREGWLTRRTHVVPHARVQSLRIVQGPMQRSLGLADFEVDSPPGPVRVRARHRTVGEARKILDVEAEVSRDARKALVTPPSHRSSR